MLEWYQYIADSSMIFKMELSALPFLLEMYHDFSLIVENTSQFDYYWLCLMSEKASNEMFILPHIALFYKSFRVIS